MRALNDDRIANGAVILAVLSALGFSELSHLRWFFGVLALMSGLAAIGVYFWNQTESSRSGCEVKDRCDPKAEGMISAKKQELAQNRHHFISREDERQVLVYQTFFSAKVFTNPEVDNAFLHRTRADEIVEIVEKLSCSLEETSAYEFVLTKDGDFLIRLATRDKHRLRRNLVEETEESIMPSELVTVH